MPTNQQKKTGYSNTPNMAKIEPSKLHSVPLPGDVLADLQDAFLYYDKEEN